MDQLLVAANIADIHFGAFDPQLQFEILYEQFINPIKDLPIDLVTIDGDLFDHKSMSNSDLVMYANKFIDTLVREVIRPKQITLILLSGTYTHDNNQLKLFYHYMEDSTIDVRVVERLQFEYVKGCKILCIPELTGVAEETYQKFLFTELYDMALMHGTYKGAVYGDNAGESRLFRSEDFKYCRGPIISGHIHNGINFGSYFYYTGSPYPWTFADTDQKGFLISLYNRTTGWHYIYKENIYSFKYRVINLDDMVAADPKDIIAYINRIKVEEGIDYLRVDFSAEISQSNKDILDTYFRNTSEVKLKYDFTKDQQLLQQQLKERDEMQQYAYLFDDSLTEYDKLARYINEDMNKVFVTADQIKQIVEEEF